MKHIALFGGSFDPPHIGHGLAIRQILDAGRFDEVWIAPSGVRYDKELRASPKDRLRMTRLLMRSSFLPGEPVFVKSHLAQNPDGYPFTIQEIEFLKNKHPHTKFTVAIGPDQAQVLNYWHNAERLFTLVDFFILVRDGRPANVPKGCRAIFQDPDATLWMNISSTELRRRLKHRQSISGLTPPSIIRYIGQCSLYL